MEPSSQCLKAHHTAVQARNDRLKKSDHFILNQGASDLTLQISLAPSLIQHVGLKAGIATRQQLLDAVHRHIGLIQQILGAVAGLGQSYTDRCRIVQNPPPDVQGLFQTLQDPVRQIRKDPDVGGINNHDKFITGQSRHKGVGVMELTECYPHGLEIGIANAVSIHIIEVLKAIEIDEQQTDLEPASRARV